MSREFQRGHRARISDLTAGTELYVGVQAGGPGVAFDISCFGLDAGERLSDDRYFVFYNQPASPEGAIRQLGPQAGDTESFQVSLDRIPAHIHKLAFTATVDGEGLMSQTGPGCIRLVAGGVEIARYSFTGAEFSTERAVMLADVYRKDGWRFAAVGQGFDGGLEALLKNFGGEVLEELEEQGQGQGQQPVPEPLPEPVPEQGPGLHYAPTLAAPIAPPGYFSGDATGPAPSGPYGGGSHGGGSYGGIVPPPGPPPPPGVPGRRAQFGR
ncbi:hypothetical protein GCM10010359_14910 [Streptomyces morookaense]|nr:hypothetical protein GCM10010359_14910 [Streptomyces morookaense]